MNNIQYSEQGKRKYAETKRLLREAMREKRLVLFVGAGSSIGSGMPSWHKAVIRIAKKLQIEDDVQTADYLKIPQYYNNEYGKKDYTQLMREIFQYNSRLYPGKVHDAIIAFDADIIITTNYDNLLEQAAENNGEFLHVISQDKDLPYCKAGKSLIKMHGDFEHDNFVLKEDDYLHYHKSFKLIETYVKSLIGSKTILFLGYSLSDPDVKHILAWVNEILEDECQQAYLIKTDKNYDIQEYQYYRHLGVNVIYAKELLENIGIKEPTETELLIRTIEYIQEEEKENSCIDSLYNDLRPFSSMNYTYGKYIREALFNIRHNYDCTLQLGRDGFIEAVYPKTKQDDELLKEIYDCINGESQDEKIQIITTALSKGGVVGLRRTVQEYAKPEEKEFSKVACPEWIDAILSFDYKKLRELKAFNSQRMSEENPELYLEQAYICSFLEDYLDAYTCLDNAALYYYRRREYIWYYIALFNKKNIGRLVLNYRLYLNVDEDEVAKIQREIEAINLERSLKTFPDLGCRNNLFLEELSDNSFSSDVFFSAFSEYEKASKQAKSNYLFFTGKPAYDSLRNSIAEYYRYGIYNYIFFDANNRNQEIYNLYVRGILGSLAAPDIKSPVRTGIDGTTGNIHAQRLEVDDIHLILRYFSHDRLVKLFDELNIAQLNVSEKGQQYIASIAENIVNTDGGVWSIEKDLLWRYTKLLSRTSVTADIAAIVIKAIERRVGTNALLAKWSTIEAFLSAVYTRELFYDELVRKNIMSFAESLLQLLDRDLSLINLVKKSLQLAIAFCQAGGVAFDREDLIKSLVNRHNTEDYLLAVAIYKNCSETNQQLIARSIKETINSETIDLFKLYARSVSNDVIPSDAEIEAQGLNYIEKYVEETQKGISDSRGDNLLVDYMNLYLENKIVNVDKFCGIINNSNEEMFKWLLNPEEYQNMRLEWLRNCGKNIRIRLAANLRTKRNVVEKFKQQYLTEYVDAGITKIIIDEFL